VGLGPAKMSVGDLGRFQAGWAAQLRGPDLIKYLFIYSKIFFQYSNDSNLQGFKLVITELQKFSNLAQW
jgi:hypothetical protein